MKCNSMTTVQKAAWSAAQKHIAAWTKDRPIFENGRTREISENHSAGFRDGYQFAMDSLLAAAFLGIYADCFRSAAAHLMKQTEEVVSEG